MSDSSNIPLTTMNLMNMLTHLYSVFILIIYDDTVKGLNIVFEHLS